MGYMVKYTHLCVVGYICKGTDDSYDVQGVLDTRKTSQIPLPNRLPTNSPTTIPVLQKISDFRGPKHGHVVEFFQKYFTHNLPPHYTNDFMC